jgi:hypothetical protein
MAVYGQSFLGNKEIYRISQRVFWEAMNAMSWKQFLQYTSPDGRMVDRLEDVPRPVESPIVVHREFAAGNVQGDILQVPTVRQLAQMPRTGSEQLKDNEERWKVNHAEVPIDTQRHAVIGMEGKMMKQRTKLLRLVENAAPGLRDHYTRTMEYLGPSYALYYGFSRNILVNPTTWSSQWSYVKTISHPHIFAVGQGKVAYTTGNPSTSGYETDVASAITNLGASDVISNATLRALKAHPTIRRIKPLIMKGGRKLRLLFLHPYQLATLEDDPDFRTEQSRILADGMAKENPLLFGASYITESFAIFQSESAVFPCRVTSSTPEFGPTLINGTTYTGDLDTFESYTSDTKFAGFILGRNAVFMGIGSGMEFVDRLDDYGHLEGIGWDMIFGFSRGDSFNRDDGAAGANIIQDGSALLLSYAPAPTLA